VPLTDHEDCLLIVIDAQPGFYPPELSEAERAAAETALERAVWLTALARALSVPVVATEEEPERNGRTDPRFALPEALVKPTFGLAGTPAILDAVRDARRDTAVLVGFETDVCVFQSAVGLLDAVGERTHDHVGGALVAVGLLLGDDDRDLEGDGQSHEPLDPPGEPGGVVLAELA